MELTKFNPLDGLRVRFNVGVGLLVVLGSLTFCKKKDSNSHNSVIRPEITSFSPKSGEEGQGVVMTIQGKNFSNNKADNHVKIGHVVAAATVEHASPTKLVVKFQAPYGQGGNSYPIEVLVHGHASIKSVDAFLVQKAPDDETTWAKYKAWFDNSNHRYRQSNSYNCLTTCMTMLIRSVKSNEHENINETHAEYKFNDQNQNPTANEDVDEIELAKTNGLEHKLLPFAGGGDPAFLNPDNPTTCISQCLDMLKAGPFILGIPGHAILVIGIDKSRKELVCINPLDPYMNEIRPINNLRNCSEAFFLKEGGK